MNRKMYLIRIRTPENFVQDGGICVWVLHGEKAFNRGKRIPLNN